MYKNLIKAFIDLNVKPKEIPYKIASLTGKNIKTARSRLMGESSFTLEEMKTINKLIKSKDVLKLFEFTKGDDNGNN